MTALLAIAAYMIAQLGIGIWASRKIRNEADYILAGRGLGYTLVTASMFASWFGAETVVGSSGRAYEDGISIGSAEPFGYALCLVILGAVFAVPLWNRKLTTLADLYRERFSVGTERLAAVILIPGSIIWAAAQVRAFGHVLNSASTGALSAELSIMVAAGFTIAYSAIGGTLADVVTDVLHGGLLIIGLFVVMFALLPHLGGVEAIVRVAQDPARVHLMPHGESAWSTFERWAIPVGGSVLATEMVSRVIAAKTPMVARRSSFAAAAMYVTVGCIPLVIGLVGPTVMPGLENPEQLIPQLAKTVLPTFFYAMFAGALISAILATVDSTLLVSSSIMSHNLLVPIFGITDERRKVRLARLGVTVFGILAYLLARRAEGILELVEQASAFGSAGTLVTAVFALFTPWGGPRTAIATLLVGLATYLVAQFGGSETPFLLSLAASLLAYVVGAMVERAPATRTA